MQQDGAKSGHVLVFSVDVHDCLGIPGLNNCTHCTQHLYTMIVHCICALYHLWRGDTHQVVCRDRVSSPVLHHLEVLLLYLICSSRQLVTLMCLLQLWL